MANCVLQGLLVDLNPLAMKTPERGCSVGASPGLTIS